MSTDGGMEDLVRMKGFCANFILIQNVAEMKGTKMKGPKMK
jgi:hypothetical protein